MARKNTPELRIDKRIAYTGGGLITGTAASALAPAVPSVLLAPQNLTVISTAIQRSAVTPSAVVNLNWDPPNSTMPPNDYTVQWALDSGFTDPTTDQVGGNRSDAAVGALPAGTLVYFRVASLYAGDVQGPWSSSVSTTTASDTTPPAAPTSLVTSWSNITGDLTISWTLPTSVNYRDTRVRIYASNGGTLLREVYATAGRYVWTKGQHYADTSGTYDTSVYLVLTSRSWSNVTSTTDLTGTATLGAVGTPSGLTHTWSGDTGTAGADLVISWTLGAAAGYRLTLDGTARDVGAVTRYTYTYDANAAEHSGTADPVVSISLIAIDALGQVSSAATATATNAAPAAATASASGTFAQLAISITASTAADLKDYRIRTYLNGSGTPTDTIYTTNLLYLYEPASTGSWRVDVAARDKFGQVGTASSLTTAATLQSVSEFVANLRARVVYSDSISTAATTLDGLKDGDLTTNVVTYTSSTPWRWTMADRQLIDRHRSTTFASSASASYYYGISEDGTTYTWYAGGTATGGVWSPVSQASEAAAQTAATTLAAGTWRIDMPALVEARYYRLGHRNTGSSYAFREFLPRSIVEADDIAAEAVTAAKIAASAVTADKINVTTLSAITGDMGTLTAGAITGGTITGVTITGATIQTAASDPRTVLDANGLTLTSQSSATYSQQTAITWKDSSVKGVYIRGYHSTNYRFLDISAAPDAEASHAGNVTITAYGYAGEASAVLQVQGAQSGGGLSGAIVQADVITIDGNSTVEGSLTVNDANIYQTAAAPVELRLSDTADSTRLRVIVSSTGTQFTSQTTGGTAQPLAVSASAVTLSAAATVAIADSGTTTSTSGLVLDHSSSGTPAAGFGSNIYVTAESSTTSDRPQGQITWTWATATDASRKARAQHFVYDTAAREALRLEASGSAPMIGVLGAAAAARQTVTGSRGGNAALASLLTAMATFGWITDSSS